MTKRGDDTKDAGAPAGGGTPPATAPTASASSSASVPGTSKRKQMVLAVSLITVELIGGMQTYMSYLVVPMMAADLHAQKYYGLLSGVGAVAAMLGLPVGAVLIHRFKVTHVLTWLTMALVVGSLACALAPSFWVYLAGKIIRSFSGSAISIASMGAVAKGLSGKARRLTLAFTSATWVISSIVGPTYAALVTHLLSWRWAMLLYLPFMVAARIVIVFAMNEDNFSQKKAPFPLQTGLLLAAGIALTVLPTAGVIKYVTMFMGIALMALVTTKILPRGTFTYPSTRHRALAVMFFMTGGYFAANDLVSLTFHDVFGISPARIGWALMGGGLSWAIMGVICGAWPARSARSYRIRASLGTFTITLSLLGCGLVTWLEPSWLLAAWLLTILWTVAGLGIGSCYVDTLNILFENHAEDDGLSLEEVSAASVMAENLSSQIFVFSTKALISVAFVGTAVVSASFTHSEASPVEVSSWPYALSWLISALSLVVAWVYSLKLPTKALAEGGIMAGKEKGV